MLLSCRIGYRRPRADAAAYSPRNLSIIYNPYAKLEATILCGCAGCAENIQVLRGWRSLITMASCVKERSLTVDVGLLSVALETSNTGQPWDY